jgi:hypothetical protein
MFNQIDIVMVLRNIRCTILLCMLLRYQNAGTHFGGRAGRESQYIRVS